MNLIDRIKNNWKTILLIIIALLYIGSCTSNCSHKNNLRLANIEIENQKEMIKNISDENDSLKYLIDMKNIIIEQKQLNVESLERTANRNIVNVVKIDTTQLKRK